MPGYSLSSFRGTPGACLKDVLARNSSKHRHAEALACLEQSRDFFIVGTDKGIEAARPLALYYSFMNLVKAFCLTRGTAGTFDRAQHGLSAPATGSGTSIDHTTLDAYRSPNRENRLQVFDELRSTLIGQHSPKQSLIELGYVLPQILPGHRLWAQATGQRERFISLHDIQFWRNKDTREVWLRVYLVAHDLSRVGISHRSFLELSGLGIDFKEVDTDKEPAASQLICFEQIQPAMYPANHPADVLNDLVAGIKPRLWATVATASPYRRYYAYLCPKNERDSLLPQILSIYALTYYLGSVTRYRPQEFEYLLSGKFGPRVQDFVVGQPLQFLYLMVSEIAQHDITKPSIL